ncbi:helix-turn-helix transcriptional regulator [Bradyrhizobium sp. BRP22]|uniref:helix-turn-helix domain-containing protein n=1 Tax=Bradyrhizobium sp. BRP22 TaxID=2793821 RepID=UPI001CD1DEEC|nr:helix-turn-helix transcriptional regulator [Bradyrhizobium sp. BRP22]MCA1452811.1 helix-turn-helix transcriptional regulator [Bradyrhizobium sp. BRP22]
MSKTRSATDVDAYIGGKIRGYRNQHKMSQEELGLQLGVTFQQVQKYEKGTNRLSGSRLQQLAQIFGCTVDELLPPQRAGKKVQLTNVDRLVATRDGMRLVDSFVTIKNETMRAAVVEMARRFEGQ